MSKSFHRKVVFRAHSWGAIAMIAVTVRRTARVQAAAASREARQGRQGRQGRQRQMWTLGHL